MGSSPGNNGAALAGGVTEDADARAGGSGWLVAPDVAAEPAGGWPPGGGSGLRVHPSASGEATSKRRESSEGRIESDEGNAFLASRACALRSSR